MEQRKGFWEMSCAFGLKPFSLSVWLSVAVSWTVCDNSTRYILHIHNRPPSAECTLQMSSICKVGFNGQTFYTLQTTVSVCSALILGLGEGLSAAPSIHLCSGFEFQEMNHIGIWEIVHEVSWREKIKIFFFFCEYFLTIQFTFIRRNV